jgi:hypothetical protein
MSDETPRQDFPKPHFSRGWYAFDEQTILVVTEAVLFPETMPPEKHYRYEEQARKASPVIDKTALLGVLCDLTHNLWHRLRRAEDQIRQLQVAVEALQHGPIDPDAGDDPSPDSVVETGPAR